MQGSFSINFCDECNEFGVVSVVNGKMTVHGCDCIEENN